MRASSAIIAFGDVEWIRIGDAIFTTNAPVGRRGRALSPHLVSASAFFITLAIYPSPPSNYEV
jgi:hypothetical protein